MMGGGCGDSGGEGRGLAQSPNCQTVVNRVLKYDPINKLIVPKFD